MVKDTNNHVFKGEVVKGDGYGKKLGFPTVNLEVESGDHKGHIPEEGVYAGTAELESVKYRAGIVVGPNDKLEAHLIGYNGDAYGKMVTLNINKFLRGYKKFSSEDELKRQIEKDLKEC